MSIRFTLFLPIMLISALHAGQPTLEIKKDAAQVLACMQQGIDKNICIQPFVDCYTQLCGSKLSVYDIQFAEDTCATHEVNALIKEVIRQKYGFLN